MMRTGDQMKPIFMVEIILQVGMVKKWQVMGWECKIDLTRHIVMGKNGYPRLTQGMVLKEGAHSEYTL